MQCMFPNCGSPEKNPRLQGFILTEPVMKPTVRYNSSQLVENRGPAVITCETSSAAETILWFFNNSPVLPDNIRMSLSADNRSLTIANVSLSDSMIYQCEAINPVSTSRSDPQPLTVAYGPENVRIDPPVSPILQAGSTLALTCTAESVPDPKYQWFLNNTGLNHQLNRTLTLHGVSPRNEGSYTCVAHNTLTGLSADATVLITVSGALPPSDTRCSCWEVTLGVSSGTLVGAAFIIIGLVLVYERRLRKVKGQTTTENHNTMREPATFYENMKKGPPWQPAVQSSGADSTYTELQHGDWATYDHLKRF